MLDNLIEEGKKLRKEIKYVAPPQGTYRTMKEYKFLNNAEYEVWKSKSIRFLALEFGGDRCISDFEQAITKIDKRLTPDNFDKLVGILESCKCISKIDSSHFDKVPINKDLSQPININVNQSQYQGQEQQQNQKLVLQVFIEAIKDELTGKQQKELKAIIQQESDPEKAKLTIIEKLKGFGENVLSNIVANIITNPAIWNGFI